MEYHIVMLLDIAAVCPEVCAKVYVARHRRYRSGHYASYYLACQGRRVVSVG